MDYAASTTRRTKALSVTIKDMWKILKFFGPTATQNFLIAASKYPVVNELLPFFPSIAATVSFMSRISASQVGE